VVLVLKLPAIYKSGQSYSAIWQIPQNPEKKKYLSPEKQIPGIILLSRQAEHSQKHP